MHFAGSAPGPHQSTDPSDRERRGPQYDSM